MKTSVGDNVNNSLELDGGTEADQVKNNFLTKFILIFSRVVLVLLLLLVVVLVVVAVNAKGMMN